MEDDISRECRDEKSEGLGYENIWFFLLPFLVVIMT